LVLALRETTSSPDEAKRNPGLLCAEFMTSFERREAVAVSLSHQLRLPGKSLGWSVFLSSPICKNISVPLGSKSLH
jgi:hypothetical protein